MAALEYHISPRGAPGYTVSVTTTSGNVIREVVPAVALVDSAGNDLALSGIATTTPPLSAGTDRSGTATTTSGGLTVAANSARKGLVGQNLSTVNIGFNEFGGTAAIGTAGTYTVAAGQAFSISTNRAVNFIAASGTAAVSMTEF